MTRERTYRVASAEAVAKECTDKDTGQCDDTKQELPLRSTFDVSIVNDTRDDSSGEDTVGECDL